MVSGRILLSILLVVSTLAACSHLVQRKPQNAYSFSLSESQPQNGDFSFTELEAVLRKYQFSKISDLLAYLKEQHPDYMSHYTLGFQSRSLHESSRENPRAIVYGSNANFIISFNGHPNQQAYEMLEVVEFNQTKNVFEFREIEFNEKGQLNQPYKISQIGGPISNGQPKCLLCHSDSRPIWEGYDIWPGFYGGDDDFPVAKHSKREGQSVLGYPIPQATIDEWESFSNTSLKQGRYQYLTPMSHANAFAIDEPRPNANLSYLLSALNTRRIAQKIKNSGGTEIRYPLLFALYCQMKLWEELNVGLKPSRYKAKYSEKIHALYSKFKDSGAEATARNHKIFRYNEILKDHGIPFASFKSQTLDYMNIHTPLLVDAHRAELDSATPTEFFNYLFNYRMGPSSIQVGPITPEVGNLVAISKYNLPKTNVDLWPTAIYEGVHYYSNGVDPEVALGQTLIEYLFSPDERKTLLEKLPARDSLCEDLYSHLSKDWQ